MDRTAVRLTLVGIVVAAFAVVAGVERGFWRTVSVWGLGVAIIVASFAWAYSFDTFRGLVRALVKGLQRRWQARRNRRWRASANWAVPTSGGDRPSWVMGVWLSRPRRPKDRAEPSLCRISWRDRTFVARSFECGPRMYVASFPQDFSAALPWPLPPGRYRGRWEATDGRRLARFAFTIDEDGQMEPTLKHRFEFLIQRGLDDPKRDVELFLS